MSYATSGTTSSTISENLELRRLKPALRRELANILDIDDNWKDLAVHISNPDLEEQVPLFSDNEISTIEKEKLKLSGSPTQALFEHWSTYGRNRVTIGQVLELLKRAQLYRAADYVSVDILNGQRVIIEPLVPTAQFSKPHLSAAAAAPPFATGACYIGASHAQYFDVFPHYSYASLQKATNNFREENVRAGGNKLGEGAFGSVYLGHFIHLQLKVAIKRLKDKMNEQFFTELETLSKFQHDNLLPLKGYSIDGTTACLLYEYMENGSLQDRLALKEGTSFIDWKTRVKIAVGSARGISHLHTHLDTPYIHRDIKSANILLDNLLTPKIGDFGLVRMGPNKNLITTMMTGTVFGTSVYMAPEAIRGEITIKLDTFSFGIVLMELLTSLAPYDPNREETDILTYVQENSDTFEELIDNSNDIWEPSIAKEFFEISLKCAEERKKRRPTLTEVLPDLEELLRKTNLL